MSRSAESSSLHEHSHLYWIVVFAGTTIGLVFGTWGYLIYGQETNHHASFLSAAYHAVQLFILHMPHLEGRVNLPLEIGRWSAAISDLLALFLFLHHILFFEWGFFCLHFARRHVVVCGLGEVGIELAREFRKAKIRVVAIEQRAETPGVAEAEQLGVTVIFGDAKNPDTLRKARADYARHVLAVCAEDDTNIAIADAVRKLETRESVPEGAKCLLLLTGPVLRGMAFQQLAPKGNVGRCRIVDVPEIIARRTFQDYPLDFSGIGKDSQTRVHLVLIGIGDLSFALALMALQWCHFANRSKLLLTVVGKGAKEFLDHLEKRHPFAKPWYETQAFDYLPVDHSLLLNQARVPVSNQFLTVAICPENGESPGGQDETRNVLLAMEIARMCESPTDPANRPACAQVLVHLHRKAGFSALLDSENKPKELASIHAFGLFETFCNRETLLLEEQDALARALHEDYQHHHGGVKWDELAEEFRESNRLASDHIPVKLRSIGLSIVDPGMGEPVNLDVFTMPKDDTKPVHPDLPLLAEMEHSRWCAERHLLGWRHGNPKDREERNRLKIHRDLVSWAQLDQKEQKKDWEQICAIPFAVAAVGKMIARTRECRPKSKPAP